MKLLSKTDDTYIDRIYRGETMRKYCFVLILFFCFSLPAFAWVDSWNNGSYYATNGENQRFNAFLGRSEIRIGMPIGEEIPLSPYIATITTLSQDQNYWNNNFAFGVGLRSMPFKGYESSGWADEWIRDVKFFGEFLTLSFLKDATTAKTNNVETSDVRVGIDMYHEWNQTKPDKKVPWVEVWSNLSYRSTNFYQGGFKNFLYTHQQKTGMHFEDDAVQLYLRTDLTMAGRSEAWWNSLYVGPGIQILPYKSSDDPVLKNFRVYIEMLSIIWYKDKNSTRPNTDTRFGIDYRLYL